MQYYALSGLGEFDSCTKGDALRAYPWLLYSAPSALDTPIRPTFEAKPCQGGRTLNANSPTDPNPNYQVPADNAVNAVFAADISRAVAAAAWIASTR